MVKSTLSIIFWSTIDDDQYRFGFNWIFTEEQEQSLRNLAYKQINKRSYSFGRDLKLSTRVEHRLFSIRLAASYRVHTGVRWVHTEIIRNSIYHKATAFFAQSTWDKIALLNNSWKHYNTILKADSIQKPVYY